jgi:hypothetical protein
MIFTVLNGFRLWRNLWRVWITPVNITVEKTITFDLCKPRFCPIFVVRQIVV